MSSKFQEVLQTNILAQLDTRSLTVSELSNKLNANYHSVRKAIVILREDGLVHPIGYAMGKNIKYAAGQELGQNNSIPVISHANGRNKMHELLELADSTKKPRVVVAYENIPLNVAQLMKAAERAANGEDVTRTLITIKTRMEQDVQALVNATKLINQILQNPRNWNPEVIKRYPQDTTYDAELVDRIYSHFFKKD